MVIKFKLLTQHVHRVFSVGAGFVALISVIGKGIEPHPTDGHQCY